MALAIANRYASALDDVVCRPGSNLGPEQALDQIESFQAALEASAELRGVLLSPAVRPAAKRDLAAQLCSRLGCSETVRNFIYVIVDYRRIALFGECVEAFRDLLDRRRGAARIEVRTARTLDADQRDALEKRFAALTGKTIAAEYVVDADVLGGSIVRVGSTVYDGSLRARLRALDRAMRGAA